MTTRALWLLSSDLLLGSRLTSAAERCGWSVQQFLSWEEFSRHRQERAPDVLLWDLSLAFSPEAVARACPASCRRVAFGPHVLTTVLQSAAAAGFDPVLTRGALFGQLESWLQRWAESPHPAAEKAR
ncbi:MAG: hypothetical protein KatS3mg114_0255 [Planctomycetaceae bacterium]|nr:MAG: hypothetical protein KatS3mg114_0255 [Planctomycetaceae bacterium]